MNYKFNWSDKEKLENIIKISKTQTEVIRQLGLATQSGNYQTLMKYIKLYNLDTSHFNGKEVSYMKLKK